MAKHGFKVMDSDMHIMEPPDLWQRYIAPEFRDRAPIGLTSDNCRELRDILPGRARQTVPSGARIRGTISPRYQEVYRDHAGRGWTADCQLEAMDTEGIDVAVLFPTRGLSVLTLPDMEPRFAAAIARAYNDWMFDFCQMDPHRLLGAGHAVRVRRPGRDRRGAPREGRAGVPRRVPAVQHREWQELVRPGLRAALGHAGRA